MNYSWSSYVDGVVVVLYLLFCLIVGFYKSKKITNIREYALSDGRTPMIVLVCTIFATHVGAGVTMGAIQKVYTMGAIFMFAQLFSPLRWVVNAIIFAKNIAKFKGCLGIGDIMDRLYGRYARIVSNFVNITVGTGIIAAQVMAMGILAEYFFHIDKLYGVLIGCGVLTFYSAFGGIRAVMLTDTLQFFIFYLGIPLGCIWAAYEIGQATDGGVIAAFKAMPSQYHSIEWTTDNIILFASLVFFVTMTGGGISGESPFIQRFLIAGDTKKLRDSLLGVFLLIIPFTLFICALGILIKIKAPDLDSNQAFSYFVDHYLPVGLKGLMIAGLLAVMMSTADSYLNTSSIIISNELVKPMFPQISAKQEVMIARFATFWVAAMSAILALTADNILDLLWVISNFWDPLLVIPVVCGFLGFRTTSKSFIGATVVALIFTCIGAYIDGKFATVSLMIGVIGSAIGLFGMHFWQKAQGVKMPDPLDGPEAPRQSIESKSLKDRFKELVTKSLEMPRISASMFWVFSIFAGAYCMLGCIVLVLKGHVYAFEKAELALRVLGYLGSFGLLLWNISGERKMSWLSKSSGRFYQVLMVFCLPFTASYLMFQSNFYIYYNITFILSLILLYLFTSGFRFILYSIIGVILGYILYHTTYLEPFIPKFGDMQIVGSLCYFLTFVAFLFERDRYKKQQAKIADNILYSGSLAHEMRSPLATIQMLNQMLSSILQNKKLKSDDIDQVLKSSKMIGEKCSKGLDSIDAILHTIRADFINEMELKEVSIISVVKDAIKLCDLPAGVKVSFKNLNSFSFLGSAELLIQVIINLILNSIKHGHSTQIDLWCETDGANNHLYYCDNGSGIDPQIVDKIFDDFYTTDSKNGSGVGLAFCKKVMTSMGGSINYNPSLGTGAGFILSFLKSL